MKNILITALVVLVFNSLLPGQNIQHLRLKSIDGARFEITSILDQGPVVLVFWATWCKPCRKELPALKDIFEEFRKDSLTIVAISTDTPRSLSKVKAYVKGSGLPYIFLVDPNGDESRRLFVYDVPYTLLADKKGNIQYSHRGYREGDELKLREMIIGMLNAKTEQE